MLSTAQRRRPARQDGPGPEGAGGEYDAAGASRPAEATGGCPRPLAVAVLMGGVGHERDVSLASGREVAAALVRGGHVVHAVVLDRSDEASLDAIPRAVDVAFLALHGEYGEDGTIQQSLARRGLTYTGSGPEASARAFDKVRAKRLFARAGLPLAWHRVLEFPFSERSVRHAVRMTPPGSVIVKPSRGGSSVGVVLCRTRDQLARALRESARFRQDLLIEEFVPGHELTCGVLDGVALPVVEAVPARGFFDYQAKYDKACGTRYAVEPQAVPAAVRGRLRELALEAHAALGCADLSRVDVRYDPAADRLAILEVNTIPGLTPTSLLPKGAAAAGVSFEALVERICRLALRAAVR